MPVGRINLETIAILAGCLLGAPSSFGQICPFPVSTCGPPAASVHPDLNCDGSAEGYCSAYDRDGLAYDDCDGNGSGSVDDFWTFYDGDFDGKADPCDPDDVVLAQPDGIADGTSAHPYCDRFSADRFQLEGLFWYHAYTLLVWDARLLFGGTPSVDVIRGDVEQLAWGTGQVSLGAVACIKNDGTVKTDYYFVVNDLQVPPPGKVWFYVARLAGPYSYGFSDCLPRLPSAGDCPP